MNPELGNEMRPFHIHQMDTFGSVFLLWLRFQGLNILGLTFVTIVLAAFSSTAGYFMAIALISGIAWELSALRTAWELEQEHKKSDT